MIVLNGTLIPDGTRIMVLGFSNLKVTVFCEQVICNIDIDQFRQLVVTREEMDKRIQEANEAIDGAREELEEMKDLVDVNAFLTEQNQILQNTLNDLIADNNHLKKQNQELNRQMAKVPSLKKKK
jgi:uncharacterized protein (DUF3084 family)